MKPILASLLLLLSTGAHAQFSLGLSGGVNVFSNFRNQNNVATVHAEDGISEVGKLENKLTSSLQGIWTKNKWQYGFEIDRYLAPALATESDMNFRFWMDGIPQNLPQVTCYKYSYPVKLFVNRVIALKRLSLSGGLSAGYIFTANWEDNFFDQPFSFNNNSPYGWVAGVQAGVTYKCSPHIFINARIAEEYIFCQQRYYSRISYTNTAFNLGLAYTF